MKTVHESKDGYINHIGSTVHESKDAITDIGTGVVTDEY